MKKIIEYIERRYKPLSIILYGSYANGSNGPGSDFDALVISRNGEQVHDTSFVDGVQLDVFVYPESFFEGNFACEDFIRIFDGKIISDSDGRAVALQNRVLEYLRNRPQKTGAQIQEGFDWCAKMLERARRCDAEGMFRWHWLLTDSLEIFCDAVRQPYFGPKKSLKWMAENHPAAFACYERALRSFSMESLEAWVSCIRSRVKDC